MKIAVCVDAGFVIQDMNVENIKTAIQDPNNEELETVIETSSIAALQLAASISGEEDTITAISYGGTANLAALQYALAFGASSVVHLTDEGDVVASPANPQG